MQIGETEYRTSGLGPWSEAMLEAALRLRGTILLWADACIVEPCRLQVHFGLSWAVTNKSADPLPGPRLRVEDQ